MARIVRKPIKINVSTRRVGNKLKITTTVNGKSKTRFV